MSMQKEKPTGQTPATTRTLAATLVRAFLVLLLGALFIAYLPQLLLFFQTGNRALESEQHLIAKEAATEVANFFQVRFDVLETAARLGNPATTSSQDQERILASVMGQQLAFQQLAFLDAQGQEQSLVSLLSRIRSGQLTQWLESGWFDLVRQGNRYVSPIYVDEATSEPRVIMAAPALDVFGDFQGVLLAEVNLKFMWDLVAQLEVGETGLSYVVDRPGNLIAFGDLSRVLRGENVSQLALVAHFIQSTAPDDEGLTKWFRGINGNWVVGTYVPLGTPDWAVVIELPLQEGSMALVGSILISLVMVVVVGAAASRVTVYLARRLSVPLLNLTTTASRIAEGETHLQAVLQGPAEVINLAEAFNSMTAQLRETLTSLEQRVVERTRGLLTAAEVSKTTTAVLDLDELLPQVVALMRDRFNLYYVGLFLVDETGEYAVLRAGSGEAGQKMMAQGWQLPVGGNSMIGRCVSSGQADIQLDVGEAPVRFSNPFLPATRSELALPLRAGGQILGAMTAQSDQEAFFSQEDITVLQTVADQVANAVRNAGLFQRLQESLEAERRAYGESSHAAWQSLLEAQSDLGFLSTYHATLPAVDVWRAEMEAALVSGQIEPGQGESPTMAVPIKVRNQVVGVIDGRKADGAHWTQEEIDLLTAMTDQLNVALEGARLYRETQRRAAREQATREISDVLQRATGMDALMRIAAEELNKVLGSSRVYVRLGVETQPETEGETNAH
ncbi:MAG TPA: GAF domain-containing protein [Anaerolineae bacterium]|nr:GAF domain-containing protein [Anaerolineae bacterium]